MLKASAWLTFYKASSITKTNIFPKSFCFVSSSTSERDCNKSQIPNAPKCFENIQIHRCLIFIFVTIQLSLYNYKHHCSFEITEAEFC